MGTFIVMAVSFICGIVFWILVRPFYRRGLIRELSPPGHGWIVVEVISHEGHGLSSSMVTEDLISILGGPKNLATKSIEMHVKGLKCPGALCYCDDHAEPHHHMTPDR